MFGLIWIITHLLSLLYLRYRVVEWQYIMGTCHPDWTDKRICTADVVSQKLRLRRSKGGEVQTCYPVGPGWTWVSFRRCITLHRYSDDSASQESRCPGATAGFGAMCGCWSSCRLSSILLMYCLATTHLNIYYCSSNERDGKTAASGSGGSRSIG